MQGWEEALFPSCSLKGADNNVRLEGEISMAWGGGVGTLHGGLLGTVISKPKQ